MPQEKLINQKKKERQKCKERASKAKEIQERQYQREIKKKESTKK